MLDTGELLDGAVLGGRGLQSSNTGNAVAAAGAGNGGETGGEARRLRQPSMVACSTSS